MIINLKNRIRISNAHCTVENDNDVNFHLKMKARIFRKSLIKLWLSLIQLSVWHR